ncbi:hypothetical protein [Archangium sp.]|uniref:hypothetical protein n=1 Tax=Archangium sp. TaxID=1872627 RepID=UPI002D319C52|nr:hypothetical protein [Archangium sp.]HYO59023.1 hypothetical protein [Archangium sp.]
MGMGKDRPTTRQIAEAIARRAGNEELTRLLIDGLSSSELSSLLLHVMRERSRSVTWADALRLVERNGLVQADTGDARISTEMDARAFAAAEGFDAVELSPVAPFGVNALTGIDQNNVLTATRGTEVLADPTIAMALECARRRKRDGRTGVVRLAASQRLIRMQPFDDPGFSRHFRLFTLVTAGRDTGDERFEQEALREQLSVWLALVEALRAEGWNLPGVRIELSDTHVMRTLLTEAGVPLESLRGHISPVKFDAELKRRGLKLPGHVTEPLKVLDGGLRRLGERMERLRTTVLEPLAARFPGTETRFDFARLHAVNYYEGPTVHIVLRAPDGRELQVGDGGFTTWTQSLLNDRKERLLTGGLATTLIGRMFRPASPQG